ncbi:2TM domain-containing protein [Arenibacter latericius]|uniref:2TM domain-containing protein n=1 Tax=Arenibacter latericius TaxID=86104 RepID=UPI0003FB1CEB|nr:2TM domain-containing protein [Arenibacter latericius]MDX1362747.1 2TM domain-containing protein [Arenibacter latericius]
MFNRNKKDSKIDLEQHQMLEDAQKRIKQKKRLFSHFVIFLIGSIFMIIINKILGYGKTYDWFIWAIMVWAFLFVIHLFDVFVTSKLMGPQWERSQRERLVAKQKQKIAELQKEIETDFPLSRINKNNE